MIGRYASVRSELRPCCHAALAQVTNGVQAELYGVEGQRTVITTESASACQEWPIPAVQTT